jgi:hypothetical protein
MAGDLSSLMQYSPEVAAGFMGINQRKDEQMNDSQIAEILQRVAASKQLTAQNAELHPLLVQAKSLENQTSTANLPRILAEAKLKGLEADRGAATQQSTINKTNFDNNDSMEASVMRHLGVTAKQMEGLPDNQKALFLADSLRAKGYPEVEGFMKKVAHVPAAGLPKYLTAMSDKYLRSTDAYAQHMDTTNATNAAHIQSSNIAAKAVVDAAQIRATKGGSGDLEDQIETELAKDRTLEARMGTLITGIQKAKETGNMDLARRLYARANALKGAYDTKVNSPRAGTVDINGQTNGRVQTAPGSDIQIPNPDAEAPPTPAPGASGAKGPAQIKAMVEAAGGVYQPDKFMYRIGPNGKVQAAPKQ